MKTPKVDRPCRLTIYLPESVKVKLDFLLFSDLQGRVPFGRYSEFITEVVRDRLGGMPVEMLKEVYDGRLAVVDALEKGGAA